jgi:tetratricopeptide (TPR) repeat protein
MDQARVVKDVTYKNAGGRDLQMDVTYPADAPSGSRARPVVVFVNGVGDRPGTMKVREWGQYRSWPKLVAASGFIGVTFDTRGGDEGELAQDVRDAFAFVRERGPSLGIDGSRIAAWACSANVRAAVALLMATPAPAVKSAVLYYGSGDTQAVRRDLPVLLVRAGRDRPQQNEAIDRLAAQAAAANAPWTVLNLPAAHHAFDVLDDTDESRLALRRTLAFLHDTLDPPPASTRPPSEALVPLAHFFAREWPEAEAAYSAYVARHPDDADAWTLLGNTQVELKKLPEAAASLRRAVEIEPRLADAWAILGKIAVDGKSYDEAVGALTRALELAPEDGQARYQLGRAQLAQHRTAEAIATLEQAVAADAGNGWAWNSLALAYLEGKQPDKAAASFERVLPFAPTNPSLLYNTACAYALAGNRDRALELLDRAVSEGYKDRDAIAADPDLAGVRADPRYQAILKKLG